MPAQSPACKSPQKNQMPNKLNYWQRMQLALEDVPEGGEQEVINYESKRRWEDMQKRLEEMPKKSKLLESKFGRCLPERVVAIKDYWQKTLRKILEDRLASEKSLAEAWAIIQDDGTESYRSLDEILAELTQFETLEEQRAYLVDGNRWDAAILLERLAKFLRGVQERYVTLLSEERRELEKTGECGSPYNESELQQLLEEIRGCSPKFTKDMEENVELARVATDEMIERRTFLLNPLQGPRAIEVVEELQLRYAASKLQSILKRSAGSEQETKEFMRKAFDILTPRYEMVEQAAWSILFQGDKQCVDTWPSVGPHQVDRVEAATEDTTIEERTSFATNFESEIEATSSTEVAAFKVVSMSTVADIEDCSMSTEEILEAEPEMEPAYDKSPSVMDSTPRLETGRNVVNIAQEMPVSAQGAAAVGEESLKAAEENSTTIEEMVCKVETTETTTLCPIDVFLTDMSSPNLDNIKSSRQSEWRHWRPGQGKLRRHLREAVCVFGRKH